MITINLSNMLDEISELSFSHDINLWIIISMLEIEYLTNITLFLS